MQEQLDMERKIAPDPQKAQVMLLEELAKRRFILDEAREDHPPKQPMPPQPKAKPKSDPPSETPPG